VAVDLCRQVLRVVEDERLRARLVEAGRADGLRLFGEAGCVGGYARVYAGLLGGRGRALGGVEALEQLL
jgi:hypothetical protein